MTAIVIRPCLLNALVSGGRVLVGTWLLCMQDARAGCSWESLGNAHKSLVSISPTLEGVSTVRDPGLGRCPLTSGFSARRNKV